MGDSVSAILGSAKNMINVDQLLGMAGGAFNNVIAMLTGMIPEPIKAIYAQHTVPCLLAAIAILALLSFEGYKIFKMLMFVIGPVVCGIGAYWYIAPLIPAAVKAFLPATISFDVLLAVLCALLAVFLTKCAFNFMVMVLGGVAGYFIGAMALYPLLINFFNTLKFLQADFVKHIVGGIAAAIMALLFVLLFKHLFIVLTSFGGLIGAALLAQTILIPAADLTIKIACAILGIAIAVFAVVYQYREEEKSLEIVF